MVFGKKKEEGKEDGAEGDGAGSDKDDDEKPKDKGATVEMR